MYDIFFIADAPTARFDLLKIRFPLAKFASSYAAATRNAFTKFFWVVRDNVVIADSFKFDYCISQWDEKFTHVFKNGSYFDGVCLFSKKTMVSKNEFDHNFFVNKKEVDVVASTPRPYDIVFISYFEKSADINFQKLLDRVDKSTTVYRIANVDGIHNAHRAAAALVTSNMFWVVDADAILDPGFNFEFPQVVFHDSYTKSIVHVWSSRNPINDLVYGYGGVKLLPTKLTLNMDSTNPDMTTSISASFKSMPQVANVSAFNTDPFSTWRSAFRECVKLSSRTIKGQVDAETSDRLDVWCTIGAGRLYGEYAISGALAGKNYGCENADEVSALFLINDYDWLKVQFDRYYPPLEK
jgi:hypothetical protein